MHEKLRYRAQSAAGGAPASPELAEPAARPGLMVVPGLSDGDGLMPLRRSAVEDPMGGAAVPGAVAAELRRSRGGGEALPGDVAGPLSEHFGMNLDAVRVHSDPKAGALAQSMQASAFTHGNDIYFAPGAYRPSSTDGQHMLAHELSHVAAQRSGADKGAAGPMTVGRADDPAEAAADRSAHGAMAALRRSVAPRTTALPLAELTPTDEIRRWPWSKKSKDSDKGPAPEYPKTVTIGGEQIEVASKLEETEAEKIGEELKNTHGIDLSSVTTVAAIKKQYTNVPKTVTDQLAPSTWTLLELRALNEAASVYAPILGAKRDESSLASSVQGVTSIGKLKNAIDTNKTTGELDDTTLGESFSGSKNIGMFEAGTNEKDKNFVRPGKKKTDVQTSLTATAIHEMAHALVQPTELSNWIGALGYWTDRNTASGKKGAEKPPTSYGKTNAAEDLCESVALYFINRDALKKKCPEREKFVDKVVKAWTPMITEEVVDTAAESTGSETPPSTPQLVGAGTGG
jgi:hypothetical protein